MHPTRAMVPPGLEQDLTNLVLLSKVSENPLAIQLIDEKPSARAQSSGIAIHQVEILLVGCRRRFFEYPFLRHRCRYGRVVAKRDPLRKEHIVRADSCEVVVRALRMQPPSPRLCRVEATSCRPLFQTTQAYTSLESRGIEQHLRLTFLRLPNSRSELSETKAA